MGRGAGASVPKASAPPLERMRQARHGRDQQPGQTRRDRDQPEDGDDRRRPEDLAQDRPEQPWRSSSTRRPARPESDHPADQRERRSFLEERLTRDDEDHVRHALSEGQAHREGQVADHANRKMRVPQARIAGDDHRVLCGARPDEPDDEPADQVPEPEPRLEEAVCPLPAERRIAIGQP